MKGSPRFSASTGKPVITLPWGFDDKDLQLLFDAAPVGKLEDLTIDYPFLELFERSGLIDKIGIGKLVNRQQANVKAYQKLKYLVEVMKRHPGFYTDSLKASINGSEFWERFFEKRSISIIKAGEKVLALPTPVQGSPLGRLETIKTEINEELIDKMQMILRSLTSHKIQKAEMGQLTKGLENLMKVYNMLKGEVSGSRLIQVNIKNMTLQEKREASLKSVE